MHLLTREYASSFRFVAGGGSGLTTTLSCLCGRHRHEVETAAAELEVCPCGNCRRATVAAFLVGVAARVVLDEAQCSMFEDECARFGRVERRSCVRCRAKLTTRLADGRDLIAVGALDGAPETLAALWRRPFLAAQVPGAPPWLYARPVRPNRKPARGATERALGGCRCGSCEFEAVGLFPGELQHCYCSICRKLSGSFQTWMPCRRLEWRRSDALELVRTTDHGRRHQCIRCGGVLTIIYDAQPDTPWPAAGAMHDATWGSEGQDDPSPSLSSIYRAIHICCGTLPPWYALPDDGLPRKIYAA